MKCKMAEHKHCVFEHLKLRKYLSIFPFLLLSKHFEGFQVTMIPRFMAQFVNTGQVGHM